MQKARYAIVFADISGSTQLYDQMGDEIAKKAIGECLDQMRQVVQAHNGSVIKTIGDELMCRFDEAENAIEAARSMQLKVQTLRPHKDIQFSIRAGVHFGEVIEEEGDIFGDAVNVAARMAGIAKAGQIITTEDTVKDLSRMLAAQTRQVDVTRVKGKQEMIAVYEVLWEDEVTCIAPQLLERGGEGETALELRCGQMQQQLTCMHGSLTIGRDLGCDLVVTTALASRQHARCEWRRGKYILVDQSTNGTYVSMPNSQDIYLRREEVVLQGSGTISLGKTRADSDEAEIIYFQC